MKKVIIVTALHLISNMLTAQFVGIGTTIPAFKLDVSGGSINTDSVYRIGGNTVLSVKGNANTFTGINSGYFNVNGQFNTGMGSHSLYRNTAGYYNSSFGKDALYNNTSGNYNASFGASALFSNTTGSENAAFGSYVLYNNISGIYNTAVGSAALHYNNTGNFNTATGRAALNRNTSGSYNVANGFVALEANVTGTGNTGIGFNALNLTNASNYNTALGYRAGYGFNHGWNNTFIGSESNLLGTGLFNSIALGNAATATASNQARIGNSSTISIGGFANWTNISDGRFKKNIQEQVKGIEFILKLRPVTYQLDVYSLSKKLNEPADEFIESGKHASVMDKEMITQSGFVAQEVEQAAKETGYDFSGVDKPKNANDFYGLRYAEFVVPLVKAVQEQQVMLQQQQAQIDDLKKAIKEMSKQ